MGTGPNWTVPFFLRLAFFGVSKYRVSIMIIMGWG